MQILHITAISAIAVGLLFMIITLAKPKVDYTEILCGGYTEQRTLSNEDKVLFRKVMGETSFISKVQYGNGGPEMKVIIDNEAAKSIIR